MRLKMLMTVLTLAGWHSAVLAGSIDLPSLACGDQAIKLGMSPAQIKSTCGKQWEPAYISKHQRDALGDAEGNDLFEKWMYKAADQKDAHVIIKNGEVVRIFTVR
jgi:hypothetical protein